MPDRDDQLAELGRLWRDQPTRSPNVEEDQMLTQVKQDARSFDRTTLWRDARETIAAIAVLAFMGWRSWSEAGWLPKAGFAVATICMLFTITHMLRARRLHGRVGDDASLVDRLQAELHKLEVQAELLASVMSWYLLPIAVGTTAWMLALDPPRGTGKLAVSLMGLTVVFGFTGWVVWKLNQYVLRAELRPRIEELQGLLEQARAGQA